MIGDKGSCELLMIGLHSQSIKSPATIFIILEDESWYNEKFWKDLLFQKGVMANKSNSMMKIQSN